MRVKWKREGRNEQDKQSRDNVLNKKGTNNKHRMGHVTTNPIQNETPNRHCIFYIVSQASGVGAVVIALTLVR